MKDNQRCSWLTLADSLRSARLPLHLSFSVRQSERSEGHVSRSKRLSLELSWLGMLVCGAASVLLATGAAI
jgi:hypothetical protein